MNRFATKKEIKEARYLDYEYTTFLHLFNSVSDFSLFDMKVYEFMTNQQSIGYILSHITPFFRRGDKGIKVEIELKEDQVDNFKYHNPFITFFVHLTVIGKDGYESNVTVTLRHMFQL